MREILYRLKICGKWAYGLPCKIRKDTVAFDGVFADGQSVYDAFADKETLGEYTGLTDKNGNKIFVGDIIKTKFFGKDNGHRQNFTDYDYFRVVYHEASFCIENTTRRFIINAESAKRFEIIGNIYDNPELLK